MKQITCFIATVALIASLSLLDASTVQANESTVLLLEKVNIDSRADLPRTGLGMDQVRQQYGEPDSRSGPVGEPPITTWRYASFSVYFEHDHVINSVRHFQRQDEQ